ncbi:MAG: malonyl-CoA decarboxylase family protein [Rhodobacteraceae bacterium]|nr:malonyl-CoA decarboxylase family protein [Paracoccaceae bacterium]
MSLLADLLTTLSARRAVPFTRGTREPTPIKALCSELMTSRGEISAATLARQVLEKYAQMGDKARKAFFVYLAESMDLDKDALRAALDAYADSHDRRTYGRLMEAAQPTRQELIRRLNQVPGATGRLVEMRADLLRFAPEDPRLAPLDLDFRHLFASWFNRGFLVLLPINWESPAHVLEKIIAYEAVHAIHSWEDLRRRLAPEDRRCFAFFHPAMPDEPLIFVEVALTRGVPGSIQELLAEQRAPLRAAEANTAVFYSISNCQAGLAGISFGNSLIKTVVADLSRELPNLKTFVTLSPIPTLMAWLKETAQENAAADPAALRALAARYLTEVKNDRGLPCDPVARFHLTNGALVHDVHPAADLSDNGLAQSGGAMVNYLYDPNRIGPNHERFVTDKTVVATRDVRGLARQAPRPAIPAAAGQAGT